LRKTTLNLQDLKIALVHDWLTIPGGSEAVFEQICSLFPGAVFASQIDADQNPFLKNLELHPSYLQKLPFAKTKHWMYAPLMPSVYANMDLSEYDLVLSDSHSFAHGVRRRPDALHINYYHTPARSLWLPEIDNRASKTFAHRKAAERLKELDLEASKRPDVIFANSKTTAQRVLKFYGRKTTKIIYPPVSTEPWLSVEKKSDEEGLLYWGRLIDYKRVDIAIDAARITGEKLNIVGSGPLEHELKSQARGLSNVKFWGRLSEDQLKDLIANSRALLFPGYEDFGIVPVEAMAAGLPVIAYGQGGVTETVTQDFGLLFPEQSVDSLVDAIRHFDWKKIDTRALKNHARTFDVSRFRKEYKEAVLEAIEQHLNKQ